MENKIELIYGLVGLIVVILLTRRYHAWRIRQSLFAVIDDLKRQGALSPETAVKLPYDRNPLMRLGLRDHRRMALQQMALEGVVGRTREGRYYLLRKDL